MPQGGILSTTVQQSCLTPQVCTLNSYADDLKMLAMGELSRVLQHTQQALKLFSTQADILGLSLSPPQCKAISIGMTKLRQQLKQQGIEIE